jgi:hypothetical protein
MRATTPGPDCHAGSVIVVRRALLGALALVLLAEAVLLRAAIDDTFNERPVLKYECAALVVFVVALGLLARSGLAGRTGTRFVLATGAVLQVLMVTKPPVDSDDDYRYLWDGKVQLAGIDPYRYAPSSGSLASVRDGYLFPASCRGMHGFTGGCTRINLPDAHTIYPPVAEAMFTLLRLLSFGGHGQHLPLQLAAAVGVVLVGWLLARSAIEQGRPVWTVALWSWCPVTAIELANNAHIDWLAVLLGVLALTVARGRPLLAGLLIGAGIATKLYPGLLGAALLRRRPVVVVTAAVALVALVYLPHVVTVGGGVLGYLPDYLNTGGYGSGQQYRLLAWVLPGVLVTPVAVVIVLAAIAWALRYGDPDYPQGAALVVVGTAVLVSTPTLPWYTPLLLALAALAGRPEWLGVVVAPTIEYLAVGVYRADLGHATSIAYAGGLAVLICGAAVRRGLRAAPRPHLLVG